ncbi:MAG: hypothetical protein KDI92_13315 [Xanthomonadales bacterium]|nr:hypothetical protein [Xanthomonadales bacterium]
MKKLASLILISISCFAFCQDQSEKATASQVELEYTLWFNQLNQYLLDSEDSYEVAMGVSALLNGALQMPKNNGMKNQDLLPQLGSVLNELIAQKDLKPETLDLLIVWCFKAAIVNNCHRERLLEKHQQSQPDNMHVYFKPLQIAVEENNQNLGLSTIARMSQAKNNHRTIHTTEQFNKTIDNYIENNPLPESYLNYLSTDKNLSNLTNEKVKVDDLAIKNMAKAAIKTAYAMFYEQPDLNPLYFLCKTNMELLQQCLNITETLIKNSNTITATGLGYAISMGIYESQNNKPMFDEVKKKQESYKQLIECLSLATLSPNPVNEIFDPKYQQIQLENISEFDRIKYLAQYVYEKHKDDNPEQINPATCFTTTK